MSKLVWFRSISLTLAMVVGLYALSELLADMSWPSFHTADFFGGGARPTPRDEPLATAVALFSFNGDFLSDHATNLVRHALEAPAFNAGDRMADNKAAAQALLATLSLSPIRSPSWLMLGMLKGIMGEPSEKALQMSYLTGSVGADGALSRLQTLTMSNIGWSEDLALLAQSDVRSLLTHNPQHDSLLTRIYRQAAPDGKQFLLQTAQALDPGLAAKLK